MCIDCRGVHVSTAALIVLVLCSDSWPGDGHDVDLCVGMFHVGLRDGSVPGSCGSRAPGPCGGSVPGPRGSHVPGPFGGYDSWPV